MKVIKEDGRIQKFDLNKIITTLEKSSDEIAEPFTESDIENLSEDVVNLLETNGADKVSVNDIQNVVVEVLKNLSFNKAAKNYMEYRKYSE